MIDNNWYLLYTKPGEEQKVADLLHAKGVTIFCPYNKRAGSWRERGNIWYSPLFPTYVFVQMTEKSQAVIRTIPGVLGFVFWLTEPAVVPSEEIEAIRNFLQDYAGIQLEKSPIDKKDRVRVIYGPLVVREGNGFEVRNSPVSVILPSIGYTLVARERKRHAITPTASLRFFSPLEKLIKANI